MMWRIFLALLKSAVMVALFEFFSPVAEAIGLQFTLIATISRAISQAAAIPYRDAEILFLLALATTVSQIVKVIWDLVTA